MLMMMTISSNSMSGNLFSTTQTSCGTETKEKWYQQNNKDSKAGIVKIKRREKQICDLV
jgi:hypothetical protein